MDSKPTNLDLPSITIIDAIHAATWEWHVETDLAIFNERWAEMLGYRLIDLMPTSLQTWERFAHPDDQKKAKAVFQQLFNKEINHYSIEYRMRHRDGHWVWVLDSGKVIEWSREGKPLVAMGIHIDITANKQLQAQAKEQEKNIQQILDHTKDIVYRMSVKGKFVYLSNAWQDILGHSVEDSIGQSFRSFIHPEDVGRIKHFFDDMVPANQNHEIRGYRLRHKSGEYRYFETSASPIIENGEVIAFAGVARDIHSLVKANQQLQKQKEEMDLFFEVNLDLLAIGNFQGYFIKLNQIWEKKLGFSIQELTSRPYLDFVHPDDLERTKNLYRHYLKHNQPVLSFVNRYRCIDDTYKHLEWRIQRQGNLMYASARDITERIRLQEELLFEKELLQTTLLSVGEGVITTDTAGKITMINQVAQQLTGYRDHEAIGQDLRTIFTVYQTSTNTKISGLTSEVIQKGTHFDLQDIELETRDGNRIPINDSLAPIKNQTGQIFGLVCVFRDITADVERQKQIEYLSYRDQLTTFFNRHYFEKVKDDINQMKNYPLCIISMDVNDLKKINDTFGHLQGDYVLQKGSQVIMDIIPPQGTIFRMGGDEFIIFMPNTTQDQALIIREKINQKIIETCPPDCQLSVAYGFHVLEEWTPNLYDGIRIADQCMYLNKAKLKRFK